MEAILDYRGKTPRKSSAGLPLVTAKIVKSGRLLPPTEFIAAEDYESWMVRGLPKVGDVVLTTEAPLGEVAQLHDANVGLAQRIITLRGRADTLDNAFLTYALQSTEVQAQLQARASGTTVMGIRQSELRHVLLPCPDLTEQRAIATILRTLDDKIDANRNLNMTLEATCQTLFRSWFVDFDPVVEKSEGRKPPHLSTEVAALFPSRLRDTERGRVPEGWSLAPLPDCFEINPTRRLRRGEVAPYLDMRNMPTHSALPEEWSTREFGSGLRFKNGDTLVARITPCLENGKTAFVRFLPDATVGWGSTEYIVVRSKPPLPLEYSYFLARTEDFRGHSIANMTGSSGRQRVPTTCYERYLIPVPDQALAEQFGSIAHAAIERMNANILESRTLAALRDALLPRLLSGELRVRQAEKLVEEAI